MRASHVVIILLTLWLVFTSAAAWAVYTVLVRPGMIEVAVEENGWDERHRMRLMVPAGIANGVVRTAGLLDDVYRVSVVLGEGPDGVDWHRHREVADLIAFAMEEIEAEEDLRILEVRDGHDHVTVDLRGGAVHVNVESWDDRVSVTVPRSTVRTMADVASDLAY